MIEILLASCGAWVFVYVLGFIKLRRKPFSCEVCMAGWFTLLLSFKYYWLHIPFMMAAAMIFTIVLDKLLKRL